MLMQHAVYRLVQDDEIQEEIPFPMTWGFDPTEMRSSLERVGQMTPMLLWPRHDRLELLAGSRRRQALRLLGRSEFKALVLPEGVGVSEALLLALEDNLNQRTLNEAEKVLVVNHLSACMDEREVAVRYLPRLGLPPRDEYLARYKGLMKLGAAGLDALAGSCLDAESGEALLAMPEKDRAAVLSLLDQLRPGRNKRRQIMTMIPEIARREDCSAASILDEADIKAVLSAENLNRPQREQRVRDILRARRYPNLTRMEGERKALIKALKLPPRIRLTPPPNFEGLDFSLEISFADPESLDESLSIVRQLPERTELAALWELG